MLLISFIMERRQVLAKPLSKEESKILLSFIESSKIIYNKATNATTNRMKTEEWKRIADQFNAVVNSCHRTPQQLRLKWENLKKNSRKRKTSIRMNNIKTSGGGPVFIPPDEVLDRVNALLGKTLTLEASSLSPGAQVLKDTVLNAAEDTGEQQTAKKQQTFLFTARASGSKRKHFYKGDENRSARNQALANYYMAKTKLIEANLKNVLLENKKLKLEIEILKNR